MTDDHKSDTMTDTTTTTTTTTSDSKKRKRESDDMDTSPPDIDDSKPRKLLGCMHYISKGKIPSEPYAPPAKPAKEWPFQLDDFQKRSIECLERRENILVSAHTSAGKTVVAEYAIALALQSKSRVIYTSPIKALSNQKYRELKETFEDVGLMTGDINLAPHASCVVMTTEILRNMLYRGSELMREVSWVIFDEVHYMRDRERGVVWEESIILLPPSIHLVFLSATLSNANEFADWIAHLKGYTCHVVSTDYRPVPLCHYVYPKMADGLFLAVDKSGHFRQHNVDEARLIASSQSSGGQRINRSRQPDLIRLLSLCEEKKWLPIICFAFSRRECENGALTVSRLDLLDEDEKALVQQVYERAMDGLTSEDRQLPQVQTLLPLLKRGIGVHHSGLLPILKEIVEILFQESLIKVLFATETFAMGINMPAKTCVFTQLRKFDGKNFRHLSSGEYIQMSGRAGRRGTDEQGICILMIDDKIETETIREMCLGASDPLISRFRLSYNMILNLMRAGTSNDPTHVIENSLHQFQYISSLPNLTSRVNELESTLRNLRDNDDDEHIQAIESYFQIKGLVSDIRDQLRVHMMRPSILLPFLQPGRVVYIKNIPASIPIEDDAQSDATEREAAAKKRAKILAEQNAREDFGWGIVINFRKRWSPDGYAVDVLLPVRDIQRQGKLVIPIPEKQGHESDYVTSTGISRSERQVLILCVMATMIHEISAIRVYCPNDLRSPVARRTLYDTLVEVKNNFPSGEFPLLTPDDMDIFRTSTSESNQSEVKQLQSRLQVLEQRLAMSPIAKLPLKEQKKAFEKYEKRLTIQTELKQVKSHARQSLVVVYQAELKQRLRVMRRLGFVDDEGVILQKGRVAAEIESADELLVTELMFDGTFSTLDPAQICALMTCLFDMDKLRNERPLHSDLQSCYNTLQSTAKRVAQICMECQLPIQEEIYLASFKSSMMNITYAWCRGASFTAICQMTEMFEGSIIRIMRRLEELLRQLRAAAKSIGNEELDAKFEAGSKMLMRGVMFAGSLYL